MSQRCIMQIETKQGEKDTQIVCNLQTLLRDACNHNAFSTK